MICDTLFKDLPVGYEGKWRRWM